ncbi:unnamed protein product [Adineta steineri]|uniref:TerB family tellurite resistance protein n=1 Tax=Adineta steineri TaxID=433720 RepID=A0A819C2T4_9BILA|nr:unnamed protein product [Adineta steineri]CAF3813715.1 unnamed protein product [Adineta steineri]
MNCDNSARDKIITDWYFREWIGDNSHLPEAEDVVIFMKLLIDIMATNGKLNEHERYYIIGRAAILGVPQEKLDELHTYQADTSENNPNFNLPHVKKTRMGLIHNLFRVLSIDHKIHPKDIKTIYTLGKKLGATEEQIQQIQSLYEDEEKLREKRASLLFPHGFNDALKEYQKLH